ncbi:MAG: Holliday junction resolvase RuvX [Selenomonadaceae bacterium]|nr:Holliday junction resolvase RuvX [Selenomonadaceae bacterium]MBR1859053.1 Holliday junction resolvase RuvX [Selenomonadaceae bacterium]
MQKVKRYLALDVGDKTIGVAVSDLLALTAQGITTIKRTSIKNDLKTIGDFIDQYEVGTIVVGLPKNMNGTEGERCEFVRKFANKVGNVYKINVQFFDERLSTVAAEKSLISADVSRRKRKAVIDKMAAVHILQGFLDGLRLKGEF